MRGCANLRHLMVYMAVTCYRDGLNRIVPYPCTEILQ